MEKRMLRLGLVLIVVGLCSSGALATTLGPPAAGLDAEQFSVGIDYSNSDMGIDLDGMQMQRFAVSTGAGPAQRELVRVINEENDFESDMISANLGYGVSDKLVLFLRLGMADATIDDADIDGGSEFAYGFGAKATYYEEGNLKLGALFQMTWGSSDDVVSVKLTDPQDSDNYNETPVPIDIDYYQLKFAVGPTYKLMEGCSIFGGPFYHLINGDMEGTAYFYELETTTGQILSGVLHDVSVDIEESSSFGGYIGAQIDFAENLPFYVEYQFTGDGGVLGASLSYRF